MTYLQTQKPLSERRGHTANKNIFSNKNPGTYGIVSTRLTGVKLIRTF